MGRVASMKWLDKMTLNQEKITPKKENINVHKSKQNNISEAAKFKNQLNRIIIFYKKMLQIKYLNGPLFFFVTFIQ